jgi:hypothetical protein
MSKEQLNPYICTVLCKCCRHYFKGVKRVFSFNNKKCRLTSLILRKGYSRCKKPYQNKMRASLQLSTVQQQVMCNSCRFSICWTNSALFGQSKSTHSINFRPMDSLTLDCTFLAYYQHRCNTWSTETNITRKFKTTSCATPFSLSGISINKWVL